MINIVLAIFILNLSLSPGGGDVARMAQRYIEDTSFDSPHEFANPRGTHTRGPHLPHAYWKHTTLNKIFEQWPDKAFQGRLRMSKSLANHLVQGLTDAEVFRDNTCQNPRHRYTARYKILTSLYYLSNGGSYVVCADAAGVSPSTLCQWVSQIGFTDWFHRLVSQNGPTDWFHRMVSQIGFTEWFHRLVSQIGFTEWPHIFNLSQCVSVCPKLVPPSGSTHRSHTLVSQNGTKDWFHKLDPHIRHNRRI